MSLTSLADAPLLSKSAAGAGLSLPKSKSGLAVTKDQACIDALFHEDVGMQGDKSHAEKKHVSPFRELLNSARNFDLRSDTREFETPTLHVSLPSILPVNQQSGDFSQKKQTKHDDGLLSKTKDANDVLAGFLADNSIDINVNKMAYLKDEKKDQSEEFKSKWNSYSSQPFTRLPRVASGPTLPLTISPRVASVPTLPLAELLEPTLSRDKKASDHLGSSNKDEKKNTTEDVLSLLPDGCYNEGAFSKSSSFAPRTSYQTVDEENSDFGGYQPSCLSISAPEDAAQQRHLTSFFSSLGSLDLKEGKKGEKHAEEDPSCILLDRLLDQGGSCNKDEDHCHIDAFKRKPSPVQDSTEKVHIDPCSVSLSRESLAQEQPGFTAEIQRLRDENLALREEIMKMEADKLKIEKDILEKELLYEPQGAEQASVEKEEAQKIAEDLALELLTVKQSLSSTEEKIECMKKVHEQEVIPSIAIE